MTDPEVWVIDSSAVIDAKNILRADSQWDVFRLLEELVEQGILYFPKQVTAELRGKRHTDTPEAWALSVSTKVLKVYDPGLEFVKQVMDAAADVVESEAEGDPADPYVLAQALALRDGGERPCVVTEDRVDRMPLKISMVTACGRLNLDSMGLRDFLLANGVEDRHIRGS